jgi:hypothetical protein
MNVQNTNLSKSAPSVDAEKEESERLSADPRALKSLSPGDSEIEELASKIEKQLENRIPVTKNIRVKFLSTCRMIADHEDCPNSMIPERCLLAIREDVQAKVDARMQANSHVRKFLNYLGFLDEMATMLEVLNRGVQRVDDTDDDFFHYQDFSFYHTRLVSRWPWMRNPTAVSAMIMLLFYTFTPVWFCHIVPDRDVCPDDTGLSYGGWLTALYFASTTMSTVGYGDVTVQKDTPGYIFVGVVYMIVALLVAVTAFSAAAENAFSVFGDFNERIISFFIGDILEGKLLHQQMRKIKIVKLTDILFQFTILNLIGMFLARFFVRYYDTSETDWSWMTTFYWAVQTTTTVGYGDLDMPFDFRWFQVIYLTVGTYFVGNALGKLANLKQELDETRSLYAWKRRIVSKGMIMDMNTNDDIVDQYEFLVSSLLSLGKISSNDVGPIMDRFRTLAGTKGYIQISDQLEEDEFETKEDPDGCKLEHTPSPEGQ